jgi:Carbohydrate-selective porin, OprB family
MFVSTGASYRGLVPTRERDPAAFALYYGGFSCYLPGLTYELVLEWTYAIALDRRLTIQPDVQYVINPGGVSSVGNASCSARRSPSSSKRRGYCLRVPLTVFEQWVRPCVVSPTVTSLVEQNWLEG